MKPKDLGYAAETWTTSALTKHINTAAKEAGFDRLSTITESGVYKILDKANIKPFRIQYYCEWRDPDFDDKMHNVLLVYKQMTLQFDENGNFIPFEDGEVTHVLSYDAMTKSLEYRRLLIRQRISCRMKNAVLSSVITNTSALARYLSLPGSICKQEKQSY